MAFIVNAAERYSFTEPCPYREGNRSSGEFAIGTTYFSRYEELLALGWRRTGLALYRYRCEGCAACVPIRIRADRLTRGKRAKRLAQRNADLSMALVPPILTDERLALYSAYVRDRHGCIENGLEESFRALIAAPMTALSEYRDANGKLIALGFLDILPKGLSSAYFAFDPAESSRGVGTYSVFAESAAGFDLGKPYYYLGFWVPGSPKMDYKAQFHPFELAVSEKPESALAQRTDFSAPCATTPTWVEFDGKEDALQALCALARR